MKSVTWRLLSVLCVLGFFATVATPARAQIGPPPQCSNCAQLNAAANGVGQAIAAQQQASFHAIQQMLENRRDQLQGGSKSIASIDQSFRALAYAGDNKSSNPLDAYARAVAPAPLGPSYGLWSQGSADRERDLALSASDTKRYITTLTGQVGFDTTWQNITAKDDAFLLGVIASWSDSNTVNAGSSTTSGIAGPGVGLYMTYVKGAFSADLAPKLDFLQLNQEFGGTAAGRSINLTTAGVTGNIQYKFLQGDNFIEPTTGFSYSHTMYGDSAPIFNLRDTTTFRLQAGARIGTSMKVNAMTIEPSLKMLVYGNVVSDSSNTALLVPTDEGLARGELDPALNVDFGDGYSMTLASQLRFGEALVGGSGSLTLRKQW